jgi:hypothetical protein
MSESNNVKFVEADGKWLWKRYDENGSVIYRSPIFNTEREAREDYDINGGNSQESAHTDTTPSETAPENNVSTDNVPAAPEDVNTAGTATTDENQEKQNEDNGTGQATI